MTQADVKAEDQHFRLFAGMQQGVLIAHVYDFTAKRSKHVTQSGAGS
jgi:hypothetical protein